MTAPRVAQPAAPRGLRLGPIPITPLLVIVVVIFAGSIGLMLWAVAQVRNETQVTLLEIGSVALAVGFALVVFGCLRGMWRAASEARSGRALILAIVAGLAGLGVIGSLTVTLILALLWSS